MNENTEDQKTDTIEASIQETGLPLSEINDNASNGSDIDSGPIMDKMNKSTTQKTTNSAMKLPFQAPSVNREDRRGSAGKDPA